EPLGRFGPGNDLFVGGMDTHNIHTLRIDDTPLLCGGESHYGEFKKNGFEVKKLGEVELGPAKSGVLS
ncbi:MAG: hypothetical protein LBQ14_07675, partial [Treponema sp.]|nr:hypothetical protein [Treponema sp.]